ITQVNEAEVRGMLKDIRQYWTPADIERFRMYNLFGGSWSYWANDLGIWAIGEENWDKFTAEVVAKGLSKGLVVGPGGVPGSTGPQGPTGPAGPAGSDGKVEIFVDGSAVA
ncbi:hypothetical protein LCGC14_2858280, partial [marine sediment metagenome]